MSAPGSSWQRPEVAASFLDRRRRVLPLIDVQEDLIVRTLRRHGHPIERFLDLGSGDGAMSELLLSEWPAAEAQLVDNSPPMLARAGQRLARFPGRWRGLEGDLSSDAFSHELDAAGTYDAAISSLAIHHLDSGEKQRLFGLVHDLLAPGAMFINLDLVTVTGPLEGILEEEMADGLLGSLRRRGSRESEQEIAAELSVAFDSDAEDKPDSVADQLRWLADAGFIEPEIHFKWGEIAIYGAARPA